MTVVNLRAAPVIPNHYEAQPVALRPHIDKELGPVIIPAEAATMALKATNWPGSHRISWHNGKAVEAAEEEEAAIGMDQEEEAASEEEEAE
jgi:hypothetical protein